VNNIILIARLIIICASPGYRSRPGSAAWQVRGSLKSRRALYNL